MRNITKKFNSVSCTQNYIGLVFLIPFIIGFIFMFAKPMIQSIYYSFCNIEISKLGVIKTWNNFDNFIKLKNDATFLKSVLGSFSGLLWRVPLVLVLSIFIAVLVKEKFPGRLLFRCILFLPVIFASDLVMGLLQMGGNNFTLELKDNIYMLTSSEADGVMLNILETFGFSAGFIKTLTYNINNIFSLCWKSGIQIVLLTIGLSAVPSDLYEVCKIEGATAWEIFWKVTFPLLTPSILLCSIYTIISVYSSDSGALAIINDNMQASITYACTQSWCYSATMIIIIGICYKILSHYTIYME